MLKTTGNFEYSTINKRVHYDSIPEFKDPENVEPNALEESVKKAFAKVKSPLDLSFQPNFQSDILKAGCIWYSKTGISLDKSAQKIRKKCLKMILEAEKFRTEPVQFVEVHLLDGEMNLNAIQFERLRMSSNLIRKSFSTEFEDAHERKIILELPLSLFHQVDALIDEKEVDLSIRTHHLLQILAAVNYLGMEVIERKIIELIKDRIQLTKFSNLIEILIIYDYFSQQDTAYKEGLLNACIFHIIYFFLLKLKLNEQEACQLKDSAKTLKLSNGLINGLCLHLQGNTSQAREVYLQGKDPLSQALLVLACEQANQSTDALNLTSQQNNLPTLFLNAFIYKNNKDFSKSLEILDQMSVLDSKNSFVDTLRGEVFYQQSKPMDYSAASRGFLTEACRTLLDIPNALALAIRGDILNQFQLYSEALESFNKSLNLEPSAFAFGVRGNYYLKFNPTSALEDFNNALMLDPDNAFICTQRGSLYLKMSKLDEALVDLNKALEIEPKNAFALSERGKVYRLQNLPRTALADFNESIILDPDNVTSWLRRSKLYYSLGYPQAGKADRQQYLAILKR